MQDVQNIQAHLETSLRRAGQVDDRAVAGVVRDEGRRLVFLLNGLIRTCRLHETDNIAFEEPCTELSTVLSTLLELLGPVQVVCVEDQIYVNDVRLRVRASEQGTIESLVGELARHEVGGLTFNGPLDARAVLALAKVIAEPPQGESPRLALIEALGSAADVELKGPFRFQVGIGPTGGRRSYSGSMRRGVAVLKAAELRAVASHLVNALPVRRAVIDLVDAIRDDPGQAAAEPLRRRGLANAEQHLLSVCSLAILLGRAIGLPDAAISDLGMAAMLHDIGSAPGKPEEDHALAGARLMLRQRGFHEAKYRRLRVVLEHHLPHKAPGGATSGVTTEPPLSLFSRILRIADDYDLLVSGRSGQLPPMSPAAALQAMWPSRGILYDPNLLTVFVQLLGLYPPGSLIELTDGRWVLSISGGRCREKFGLPVVRVVRDARGEPQDLSETLDLYTVRDRIRPLRVLEPSADEVDVRSALEQVFGEAGGQ